MLNLLINRQCFLSIIFGMGLLLCSGCLSSSQSTRRPVASQSEMSNLPESVDVGYGRILQDNPIILTGDEYLPPDYPMGKLLSTQQNFITFNTQLIGECQRPDGTNTISLCYQSKKYKGADPLINESRRWAYDPTSEEFLEVNTFGHSRIAFNHFLDRLDYAYRYAYSSSSTPRYHTAIPSDLFTANRHWYGKRLYIYSECNVNPDYLSYFTPATYEICFAPDPDLPSFRVNQDPSVIYHELFHAYVMNIVNLNNLNTSIPQRLDLGVLLYDEAFAINEGLADFYTYSINERAYVGEWGLGRFYKAARALSEKTQENLAGLSSAEDSRLSYPRYLDYDMNAPHIPVEDTHYAGQVTSHFLVALNEELQEKCSLEFKETIKIIYTVLIETMAFLGDLSSKGEVTATKDQVNLSPIYGADGRLQSKLWYEVVNPINYRRFFQTFARILLNLKSYNPSLSSCSEFTQNELEKLLDMYGLLLFKTYNDNHNGYDTTCTDNDDTICQTGHSGTVTAVNIANRKKSLLIPKKHLKWDPNPSSPKVYIFDDRENILNILSSLRLSHIIGQTSSLIPSDLRFNNGNAKLSPGEIAGVALNLYNNSNATMAGVHILANNWDHAKLEDYDITVPFSGELKLCSQFEDQFPAESEGSATLNPNGPYDKGDCEYITRNNGVDSSDQKPYNQVAPICFVQLRATNETRWVSQEKFREMIELDRSQCLLGSDSPYDCFIRVIPGGEQAFYSKMAPKKTWAQTFTTINGPPNWTSSHLIMMELSPHIPPGTTFDCRFRARFTNCDDCWQDNTRTDSDDFLDFEYSGATPFKILHYQFTVID